MASTSDITRETRLEEIGERPGFLKLALNLARRQPLGLVGAAIVLSMLLVSAFAQLIAPYDPVDINFENMLIPPGPDYLLGTDQFGRDILSRLIYGAQTALFVGFTASFAGSSIGLVFGVTSAYLGGKFDLIFQRVIDIMQAFPLIVLALVIVSIFGSTVQNVIIAITIPFIPDCARVVRANALAIREIPYIDAARANGFSNTRIVLRHMVPNVMAPYLIMITTFAGHAILLEASLSYLGLGVQEPTPAWGLMLQGGAEEYAESAPWVAIFPGIAISLAVFGFNMFGDAVRDVLDPKLRAQ